MFHEIIHGYRDANQTLKEELNQHLEMAQNYVDKISSALIEVFPTLSLSDANALVLGGFGQIQELEPGYFNALIAKYNLSLNNIITTREGFKSGNEGTKCN